MHETALVAQLLTRIGQLSHEAGAREVTAVHLQVGELSGVEPELLRSAFDLLMPGTVAERARLEMDRVPLEAQCDACDRRFRVERFRFDCPSCGIGPARVVAGEDVIIESVTIC